MKCLAYLILAVGLSFLSVSCSRGAAEQGDITEPAGEENDSPSEPDEEPVVEQPVVEQPVVEKSYTVGGKVTGLTSGKVVLQNSTETVSSTGGAFSFPAKLVVKAEPEKITEPEQMLPDPQALQNPPGKILRISYKLTRQLTEADREPLSIAASYVPYIELWRSEFPKLNGENGKPLLDEHMCNYFAFHYSFERNGFQVLRWMKEDFRRYSEKTFVPAEDMNVEWVDCQVDARAKKA